jgi:hypothetical protein
MHGQHQDPEVRLLAPLLWIAGAFLCLLYYWSISYNWNSSQRIVIPIIIFKLNKDVSNALFRFITPGGNNIDHDIYCRYNNIVGITAICRIRSEGSVG